MPSRFQPDPDHLRILRRVVNIEDTGVTVKDAPEPNPPAASHLHRPDQVSRLSRQQTIRKREVLRPADLKRLNNFEFATRLVVEGYFHGKHRSPFNDFSSEFADYRHYTPGDDIRRIDWRALARTDRYYIKLYRKETDLHSYVLLDNSASMAYAGIKKGAVSKLEYGDYLAASLSYLIVKQRDRAGFTLTEDPVGKFIPPAGTHQGLQKIVGALEHCDASGNANLAQSLEALFGLTGQRRGLVVVISDFLDDLDPIFRALGMFTHKGYAVLLVQVLTDEELFLPAESGPALYRDLESPNAIAADPDSIRSSYQQEITAFLSDVSGRAKARRIHYELGVTSRPYDQVLEAFLTARA